MGCAHHRPTRQRRPSAERCPLGTSAPQRGRRDLALRKLLVAHILGSPLGGAVAVRRLRGQPASASTQPMRGGRWQLALSVLANASPPPPKGEARLGSPFGGAVAARRLRGQLASAPHNSVSPRRRLYQRAVHAWGGWTGKRSGNYAGPNGPVRESRLPPRVLSASGRRPTPTDAAAETER